MYLFHATDMLNLPSIIGEGGLSLDPPHRNWDDMYCEGKIFLAFTAEAAESYVEASDTSPESIIIFRVDVNKLDEESIGYDWNNLCETEGDINSCIYTKNIPLDALSIISPCAARCISEDEFRMSDVYERRILRVFDEEVETNVGNKT